MESLTDVKKDIAKDLSQFEDHKKPVSFELKNISKVKICIHPSRYNSY